MKKRRRNNPERKRYFAIAIAVLLAFILLLGSVAPFLF
jgi:hypothetical protein